VSVVFCKGIGECTSGGGEVWGSNPYACDSNACRAAAHSGAFRDPGNNSKGFYAVLQTGLPGQSLYASSTQNGITTSSLNDIHARESSFTFLK